MQEALMGRPPGKLTMNALIYTTAFLWATVLAVVAVAGGAVALVSAVLLAVVGGLALAWVREHV